jgi:hypothetical protein
MEAEMEQTNQFKANHHAKQFPKDALADDVQDVVANGHACRVCQRNLRQANDHLRRANRDLGELAAFIAASLTTATAVEAVINIAVDKIGFSKVILHTAFDLYLLLLAAILILGVLRFGSILYRRSQAEQEVDQAKKGIYRFCPPNDWLQPEE